MVGPFTTYEQTTCEISHVQVVQSGDCIEVRLKSFTFMGCGKGDPETCMLREMIFGSGARHNLARARGIYWQALEARSIAS